MPFNCGKEAVDSSPSLMLSSVTQNITCIWQNVIGVLWGFNSCSLKTSWKCVATRTFGHSAPLFKRCFRTPQKIPAPSVFPGSEHRHYIWLIFTHLWIEYPFQTHPIEWVIASCSFEVIAKLDWGRSWKRTGPIIPEFSFHKLENEIWSLGTLDTDSRVDTRVKTWIISAVNRLMWALNKESYSCLLVPGAHNLQVRSYSREINEIT